MTAPAVSGATFSSWSQAGDTRTTATVCVVGANNAQNWIATYTTAPTDTTAPETTIGSHPGALTTSGSASFSFSSNETGSSFQCRLDSGTYAACTSPRSLHQPEELLGPS